MQYIYASTEADESCAVGDVRGCETSSVDHRISVTKRRQSRE